MQINDSDILLNRKRHLTTSLHASNKRNKCFPAPTTPKPLAMQENALLPISPKTQIDACLGFIFFLKNAKNRNSERFTVDKLVHPSVLTSSQLSALDKTIN
jgi:hypothetical protein